MFGNWERARVIDWGLAKRKMWNIYKILHIISVINKTKSCCRAGLWHIERTHVPKQRLLSLDSTLIVLAWGIWNMFNKKWLAGVALKINAVMKGF